MKHVKLTRTRARRAGTAWLWLLPAVAMMAAGPAGCRRETAEPAPPAAPPARKPAEATTPALSPVEAAREMAAATVAERMADPVYVGELQGIMDRRRELAVEAQKLRRQMEERIEELDASSPEIKAINEQIAALKTRIEETEQEIAARRQALCQEAGKDDRWRELAAKVAVIDEQMRDLARETQETMRRRMQRQATEDDSRQEETAAPAATQ